MDFNNVPHPEQLSIHCPPLPSGSFKKLFFWGLISGVLSFCSLILVAFCAFIGEIMFEYGESTERMVVAGILIFLFVLFLVLNILGSVLMFILTFRSWRLIQDGYARTTPWRAILFLFIPFFNFYWIFVCFYGLATNLNKYKQRYNLNGPQCHQGLMLTSIILSLFPYLNFIALFFAIPAMYSIARTADEINDARLMASIQNNPEESA